MVPSLPDSWVLAPPPHPEPVSLYGFGQVHSAPDPSDESRTKLRGHPPHLENPQCRHLLPALRSRTRDVRTSHPLLPHQTGRSHTPPLRRNEYRSGCSPLVLSPTSQKARLLHQHHLHHIPPRYVSAKYSPLFPRFAPFATHGASSSVSCFSLAEV